MIAVTTRTTSSSGGALRSPPRASRRRWWAWLSRASTHAIATIEAIAPTNITRSGAQIGLTHDWMPLADPADYVRHAVSIAHGHGMAVSQVPHGGPSALRPPAYPYFLGSVFAASGDSWTAGRIASALLGVLTVALIGLIAQLLWGRRVAIAAAFIAAVYPPLVLLSGTLLSESL